MCTQRVRRHGFGGATCSETEKKFLRRTAVELSALPPGSAKTAFNHIDALQEVMAEVGETSVPLAKAAMRKRGAHKEASMLGRLSKLRNAEAHPDIGLALDVAAAMKGEEDSDDDGSRVGSGSEESVFSSEILLAMMSLQKMFEGLQARVLHLEEAANRDALDVWFADRELDVLQH